MANIETKILSQSRIKPTVGKRFVDDGTSLWDIDKQEIDLFLEQAKRSLACESRRLFRETRAE